jgi:hypothetical protein
MMAKYAKTEVSEQQLEGLVRQYSDQIEEGLVFIDHQCHTDGGRLDVLLRDSGGGLVVAELKVVEDDGMLMQAVDYYDYVSRNREAFCRLYAKHKVSSKEDVRLVLIAPSFSSTLIGRCRWVNMPISLFTYNCLRVEGIDDLIPVFDEKAIPPLPPIVESYTIEDHLAYIVDAGVRARVERLLGEIEQWAPGRISIDPIKYSISMKVRNHLFAYLDCLRKRFNVQTYDRDGAWKTFPVHDENDLTDIKALLKENVEAKDK